MKYVIVYRVIPFVTSLPFADLLIAIGAALFG